MGLEKKAEKQNLRKSKNLNRNFIRNSKNLINLTNVMQEESIKCLLMSIHFEKLQIDGQTICELLLNFISKRIHELLGRNLPRSFLNLLITRWSFNNFFYKLCDILNFVFQIHWVFNKWFHRPSFKFLSSVKS